MAKATAKKVAVAKKPAGLQDITEAKKMTNDINKALRAIAAEYGVEFRKRGTVLFKKSAGRLTMPTYIFVNPAPVIEKGTRVSDSEGNEGEVTKVVGANAFVQFDGVKKVRTVPKKSLTIVEKAPEAKRKNVLPTLAQGVEVVPGTAYAVKGGGSAVLHQQKEGRVSMWAIDITKPGKPATRFGTYGRSAGKEGAVNRRFAETQLRWITAGKKGAKKSNPNA